MAVHNAGLRFLPSSPYRDKLIKEFEVKLSRSFKLSKINFSLDMVQSILVYLMGVHWGRFQLLQISLFRLASLIVRSFGIEYNAPKNLRSQEDFLEIVFAIRHLVHIESIVYVLTPNYFPENICKGCFIILIPNSKRPSNLLIRCFSTTYNWNFSRSSIRLIAPKITIQQFSTILQLSSTECICKSNFTLKELNQFALKESNDNHLATLKGIDRCVMEINQIYKEYFENLCKIVNYLSHVVKSDILFTDENKTEVLLICRQQFHITKLYICFVLTRVLDLTPHLTVDKLNTKLKPLYYILMEKHLLYAVQLFYLIKQIHSLAPFSFHRSRMLVVSARIITKHIYLRSSVDYLTLPKFFPTSFLFEVLNQIHKCNDSLKEVDYYHITSLVYSAVLKALFSQYKISLVN